MRGSGAGAGGSDSNRVESGGGFCETRGCECDGANVAIFGNYHAIVAGPLRPDRAGFRRGRGYETHGPDGAPGHVVGAINFGGRNRPDHSAIRVCEQREPIDRPESHESRYAGAEVGRMGVLCLRRARDFHVRRGLARNGRWNDLSTHGPSARFTSLNSYHAGDGVEEGGGVVADAVFEDGFGFAEVGNGFVGVAIHNDEVGGFAYFDGAGLVEDTE